MLSLNSLMVGSTQPKVLAEFYQKVIAKKPDMSDGDWAGWQVGASFFGIGSRDDVKAQSVEPGRVMYNFQTADVTGEFTRIRDLGAKVIAKPYKMGDGDMWIATFADPDGNYFQLMSPWKGEK